MAPFSPSYLQLLPPCQAVSGDLPRSKSGSIYGSARDHQQRWGHPSPPALQEIALEIELCQELPGVKWSLCRAPAQDLIPSEGSIFPSLLLRFARDGGNQCTLPCGLEQCTSVVWMCKVFTPKIDGSMSSLPCRQNTIIWVSIVIPGIAEDLFYLALRGEKSHLFIAWQPIE